MKAISSRCVYFTVLAIPSRRVYFTALAIPSHRVYFTVLAIPSRRVYFTIPGRVYLYSTIPFPGRVYLCHLIPTFIIPSLSSHPVFPIATLRCCAGLSVAEAENIVVKRSEIPLLFLS